MKKASYTKIYQKDLKRLTVLKDREFRLYIHYLSFVIWDSSKSTFGSTNKSLREIKRESLPKWSISKIFEVQRILIEKGFLTKHSDGRIEVKDFYLYRLKPAEAALAFHELERGAQVPEHLVQNPENVINLEGRERIQKLKKNAGF